MSGRFVSLPLAITLLTVMSIGLAGCFLAADREIDLDIAYPTPQASQVTVKYRVPPPPVGKVYVLWIINPDLGETVKIGQIPSSSGLSIVKVDVDFPALGAIVSVETSVNVDHMSDSWALKAGQLIPTAQITPRPK